MEFRILGPLEVESEGHLLPIGSRQPRGLLTVLLLDANRVVSRDRLVEALWGDEPPERAANALQVYVSQLRKAMGRDVIVTQQHGYLIRVAAGQLDLERFDRLATEARRLEPEAAALTLRQALSLWRGQPLADLADSSFVEGERRRLEELRLGALEARIEADLALGEHTSLVSELEALVREQPLREHLRGQLMLALYRCGRQAEALEVYRQGRRLLADELGLEPGEALKRLERGILEQDPAMAPPVAFDEAPPSVQSEPSVAPVPTGTVSFLFTDIEGSTRLVQELGDDYGELLETHRRVLREAFQPHGGLEIDTQGDAFFFAFRRARDAVAAAVAAQRALVPVEWPRGARVSVRVGIHTGEPGVAERGYHGLDVVRAARISGAAHGGQILVSSATRDLVGSALPEVSFSDLGEHRLKGIDQPQRIFQALAAGLREDFPPLRTGDGARVMTIGGREDELAAAAQAAVGAAEQRLRLFRRSRVAAILGVVVLAGAAAGIAAVLTGGGSGPVTVVANSVAAIDPRTNAIVADVAVGAGPVALATGGGAVWVANGDDGTVSRIDPVTERVVSTIGIGADVSDIAFGFGSVWVAGGNAGTLTRIDPKQNAKEATLTFGNGGGEATQPVFAVAAGGGSVWVTRGDRVLRIDPNTNGVTASVPTEPPFALAVDSDALWVTTVVGHVLRLDPVTGAVTGTASLPDQALAAALGGGSLWLLVTLNFSQGQVRRVDTGTMSTLATAPGGRTPADLAWGESAIWVASRGDGTVRRIDPSGTRLVATIKLGQQPTALAVGARRVWVALQSLT